MDTKLWTKDFTIITVGSLISMMGSTLSGFAISLLVLDYTNSSLLYAIYIVLYTAPQLVMPIFSGAILDRFSRKKTIYTLDFISSALYLILTFFIITGHFNFTVLAIGCFIMGGIFSIYQVAYDSFYPLLISEENYSKAYSIASVLETLAMIITPISALVYNWVGITPLLIFDACSFFIAACMETRIETKEEYIEEQEAALKEGENKSVKLMFKDIKDGLKYLFSEKGLLAVCIYFTFCSWSSGAIQVIDLPYFKANYDYGEYLYMLVYGMAFLGRGIGGAIHYKKKLPVNLKYVIALIVYISTNLLDGFYLFFPIPVMMIMMFANGILGITSYTIRLSATQSYVPDTKKGRFNGAFNMLNTAGTLLGELVAGTLCLYMSQRLVLAGMMMISVFAAIIVIGGNRKHVEPLYNRE